MLAASTGRDKGRKVAVIRKDQVNKGVWHCVIAACTSCHQQIMII